MSSIISRGQGGTSVVAVLGERELVEAVERSDHGRQRDQLPGVRELVGLPDDARDPHDRRQQGDPGGKPREAQLATGSVFAKEAHA